MVNLQCSVTGCTVVETRGDTMMAAIELMKCNMRRRGDEGEEDEGDSDSEIQQLKQKIRLRRQQIRRSRLPPCASSSSQHSKLTWQ